MNSAVWPKLRCIYGRTALALQLFLQLIAAGTTFIVDFRRAFLPPSPGVDTCQYGTQCLSLAFDLAMPFKARIIPLMFTSFPRICQLDVIRRLAQPIHRCSCS